MSEFELSLSVYLSLAAHHQTLAFQYTSERSIKRHARLAEFWYRCAEGERQFLKLPRYKPGAPIWAQPEYVAQAMKRFNQERGV